MKLPKTPELTPKELERRIYKALESTNDLNFLERYALFMGKAQLIELALKRLLIEHFGHSEESLERCTLGGTIRRLEKVGLRGDFISILKELNEYRNEMAHSFLLDDAIIKSLLRGKTLRGFERTLICALYEVERVTQVFIFLSKHKILV